MINNKILIVHDYPILENEGGPRGYYNKCIYLNEPVNLVSLNDVVINLKKISLKKRVLIKKEFIWHVLSNVKYRNINLANKFIKIPNHKFLYFHDIYSFNDIKHLIGRDQIVIFQPHSPELPSVEELNTGISEKKYNAIVKLEKAIFNRANYIILPNQECLSIYKAIISEKHKILFLRTGIKSITNLNKIPLDHSKINLFYIGRRNDIKGFPVLLKNFKKAIEKREDLRLFIAGSGDYINDKNIIDIGPTNRAYDWINSMDYVVSPNKSSYFDLNVLESIAIGIPIIMTTTQGHHFFKNKKGIISITHDTFYDVLIDKSLIKKDYKEKNQKDLLSFYEKDLSSSVYKLALENLCNTIILENY